MRVRPTGSIPRRSASVEVERQGSVMAKQAARPREWDMSVLRGAKAAYLGRVVAADKDAAIDKAADEFKLDKARRFRLIAEPVE